MKICLKRGKIGKQFICFKCNTCNAIDKYAFQLNMLFKHVNFMATSIITPFKYLR